MNDSAHSGSEQGKPILFFDGVCGLCNRFVDLLLKSDSRDQFRYAPLQGDTAQRMLGMDDETGNREIGNREAGDRETGNLPLGSSRVGGLHNGDPQSFVFLENDRRYEQSSAVLLALRRLGGVWRLIVLLYVFPRPMRDFVYRIVARNRYRWFGRREACRLPAPEERGRFLP